MRWKSSLLLCLALMASLAALPAVPAAAAECLPAGGQTIPDPSSIPSGDFVVVGGGWGHGVGMSQYGAQGAARLGCSVQQILQTYYPGITVGQASALPESIRVSLWPERPGGTPVPAICLRAHTGAPNWMRPDGTTMAQPTGSFWRVDVLADGSYRVRQFDRADACRAATAADATGAPVWAGGAAGSLLRVPLEGDPIVQLTSKSTNAAYADGRPYAHGTMEFFSVAGATFLTLQIDTAGGVNALERYLRGLSEMPSSWEPAALQAQAITGRSYAQDKWEAFRGARSGCRCDLYDSTSDQVYSGYLKEIEPTWGQRWVAAVDATAGRTMRYGGKTAVGYYSSSHGGYSESNTFVWGSAQVPYLRAVDDTRWELQSTNTLRRWTQPLTKDQIGAAFGVGSATSVTTPDPKGLGGRIGDPARGFGGVRIQGTAGTVTVSGDSFRSKLGLRSTLFTVRQNAVSTGCAATGASTDGVSRASGPDRVATAVAVAQAHWPAGGSPDVLLATSENFPDALASGSLAAAFDAPLLLTPKASLPAAVKSELARLGAKKAWILGGEGAVSFVVEDSLRSAGYATERVRGASRFETAAKIAVSPQARQVGTVAIAMDQDWPSGVTAGAYAALPGRVPTLLVQRDAVPEVTQRTLAQLGARQVVIVGGTGLISTTVENRLRQLGYAVRRVAGDSRYATSAAVAHEVLDTLGGGRTAIAATGKDFPDALAATALAAHLVGPLVLAPPCSLGDASVVEDLLADHRSRLDAAVLVGGTSALSDRVREQVAAAIRG
jgi:stage II sporulation protein D